MYACKQVYIKWTRWVVISSSKDFISRLHLVQTRFSKRITQYIIHTPPVKSIRIKNANHRSSTSTKDLSKKTRSTSHILIPSSPVSTSRRLFQTPSFHTLIHLSRHSLTQTHTCIRARRVSLWAAQQPMGARDNRAHKCAPEPIHTYTRRVGIAHADPLFSF